MDGVPTSSAVAQAEVIKLGSNLELLRESSLSEEESDGSEKLISSSPKMHGFKDLDKRKCPSKGYRAASTTESKKKASILAKATKKKDKLQVKITRRQAAKAMEKSGQEDIKENLEAVRPKKRGPGRPRKSEYQGRNAKTMQAEVQRDHRDRKNRSIDIMRRVLPGVSDKLDTAGVLEMGISYVLYLHKQMDQGATAEEFLSSEVVRKIGM
jgi:hypothetical protein